MKNRFHLVLETPQPNLVAGMKLLLGSRFNRRHKEFGHLFSGRVAGDGPADDEDVLTRGLGLN